MTDNLLTVNNLETAFFTDDGVVKAVDRVSFAVKPGEVLGIAGESGSGKSVASLSVLRLLANPGRIVGGEILFDGENLLRKTEAEMQRIRGNRISMIFQEPMTSLNPVFTVGFQVEESILQHQKLSWREARERAVEVLRLTGIPSPNKRINDYPHQLSGGMRQRVMIAMALACNPALLIADEPTTALDVTIQGQIITLMEDLNRRLNTAIMLITHDLGVLAEFSDRVIVMYAGRVMESANTDNLFDNPRHPYTIGLLRSIPRLDRKQDRLIPIPGNIPTPTDLPAGCRFHPRCEKAMDICRLREPEPATLTDDTMVACWLHAGAGGEEGQ
jgi:oligopeptide/dipeptide ABC transporter ATP-binding protein